jgi:hypothetical protein
MQASEPIPGEPWPHAMAITVTDASSLLFLLFVRSAWRISTSGVPELETEPALGASGRPPEIDPLVAEIQWHTEWDRAWQEFAPRNHGVHAPDAATQRMLDTLSDEELWEATSTHPSDFWDEGVDRDALGEWEHSLRDNLELPLDQHPERRALPALIEAWRTGLNTIIELPFAGYYADRIDRERLVVSLRTRRDPMLYAKALRTPLGR